MLPSGDNVTTLKMTLEELGLHMYFRSWQLVKIMGNDLKFSLKNFEVERQGTTMTFVK